MFQTAPAPPVAIAFIEWLLSHIAIIGWPAFLIFIWKFRGKIDEFLAAVKLSDLRLTQTQAVASDVLTVVNTIKTNHLEHLAKSIDAMQSVQVEADARLEKHQASDAVEFTRIHVEADKLLSAQMDANKSLSEANKSLDSIDKGISILVDRGRS